MRAYEVKSEHSIEEVFSAFFAQKQKFHSASLLSKRLQNFFHHGVSCIACNTKGRIFRIERHKGSKNKNKYGGWHLNLYGFHKDGSLVMMTADHIIPRSRGGKTTLDNLQPMCEPCNSRKGNLLPGEKKPLKQKHGIPNGRRRVCILNYKKAISLSWLIRALVYVLKNRGLPGLPYKRVRKKNLKWYNIKLNRRGRKHGRR